MALQRAQVFARDRIPEADRPVCAARGQQFAVGGKGNGIDDILMAAELEQLLAGDCLPQAHYPVVASRGDGAAVGGEGDREHTIDVTQAPRSQPGQGPVGKRIT
jgi:hypothetical protein